MAYRDTPFEQMNRLFEQMHQSMWHPSASASRGRRPAFGFGDRRALDDRPDDGRWGVGTSWGVDSSVALQETDEGYVVMADLPGFETDDLSIRFEDGVLTLRGESELEEESESASRRRSRRVYERVSIPGAVDVEAISVSYHNGVLEVSLPAEEDREDDAHHIDIN